MRALRLMQPDNMAGPDVSDWQTFLQEQNINVGKIDGVFGPKSDTGTRAYQTHAGLSSDGVVGMITMARAVSDGYQSTTGANVGGMDSNVNCVPFLEMISGQGMKFVARYYSSDPAKTLTAAEARALSDTGLSIVTVFEDSNDDVTFFSAATGQAQAVAALQQAIGAGQPQGSAIYFAVDYDASAADVNGPITAYFTAVKNAFSAASAPYAVGVYGSGLTCSAILGANLATFAWLAGGMGLAGYSAFRPSAHIVQLAPERIVGAGLEIDDNIAQVAAFGSFQLAPGAGGLAGSASASSES